MEQNNQNLPIGQGNLGIQQSPIETLLAGLEGKKVSFNTMTSVQFKTVLINCGFLNQEGCPVCGILNFETNLVLRPVIKEQLIYLKKHFLSTEMTLCAAHLKKRIIENRGHVNLVAPTSSMSGNLTMSPRAGRMFPNTAPSSGNAQNRLRPQYANFRSSNSAFGPANASNCQSVPFGEIRPLGSRLSPVEANLLEDIPPYNAFGPIAISSPKTQNNVPRSAAIPIPRAPISSNSRIWGHIEHNVVSPLVSDTFRHGVPNAEEAYFKFRENHTNALNQSTVTVDEEPHRMAYTKNFRVEPPENPSSFTASSTNSESSGNSSGILNEISYCRRGKKILGKGIYKK